MEFLEQIQQHSITITTSNFTYLANLVIYYIYCNISTVNHLSFDISSLWLLLINELEIIAWPNYVICFWHDWLVAFHIGIIRYWILIEIKLRLYIQRTGRKFVYGPIGTSISRPLDRKRIRQGIGLRNVYLDLKRRAGKLVLP